MMLTNRLLALVAVASLSSGILAAGVVGVWKGKVTLDATKAPKPANDQQKKQMEAGMAIVKKLMITLNLKANKSYTADAKNVPGKPAQRSEGTWKQEGTNLWLTAVRDNGKPAADKKPQKFAILEGGRKLSLAAEGMPPWVKITFTR